MSNPIGWFEIYVQDMPRARAFYEALLGVTLTPLAPPGGQGPEMWAWPMDAASYGAAGALVRMDGVPSGGGGTLVYFSCADCAVEAGRAAAAGGSLHCAKTAIGEYGHIAHVIDTEGNRVGLHSM